VISAWGNFGLYALSAMGATGRGLTFGPNRFGGGDLLSALTFLVAYPRGDPRAGGDVLHGARGVRRRSRGARSGTARHHGCGAILSPLHTARSRDLQG
jgi:hypothetical protein